jgi:hypothetical protein
LARPRTKISSLLGWVLLRREVLGGIHSHARYARRRAEAMEREMGEAALSGASVSVEDARASGELLAAISELEKQTADEDVARRRVAAKEAASKSRQLAITLRRRRSEADGSDERARQEYREHMQSIM